LLLVATPSILTSVDDLGKMRHIDSRQCSEEGTDHAPPSFPQGSVTARMGRHLLGEFLGTVLLVTAVIGSGIMASRLSPNDIGLELLENAAATAGALVAIILAIGPASGAQLDPVVTLADRFFGGLNNGEVVGYITAQVTGGVAGAVVANLMFSLPAVELSTKVRSSGNLWFAKVVATFGLLLVIFGVVRSGRASAAPFAVGAYIGGAYFFTASTSFARPAVTFARTFSNTFAGINPSSVPPFIRYRPVGARRSDVECRDERAAGWQALRERGKRWVWGATSGRRWRRGAWPHWPFSAGPSLPVRTATTRPGRSRARGATPSATRRGSLIPGSSPSYPAAR